MGIVLLLSLIDHISELYFDSKRKSSYTVFQKKTIGEMPYDKNPFRLPRQYANAHAFKADKCRIFQYVWIIRRDTDVSEKARFS